MPSYDYYCPKCDSDFEIIESIREYTGMAQCPECRHTTEERTFHRAKFTFIGTKVEDREFNHGLGIVTKNSKHRADEAKARGLIEVGTESPKKMHDSAERSREERRKKSWDEV
jgi:putative FmdB family regulatory protein